MPFGELIGLLPCRRVQTRPFDPDFLSPDRHGDDDPEPDPSGLEGERIRAGPGSNV